MTGRSRRAAFGLALAAAAVDLMLLGPGAASADAPVAVGSWHLVRQQTPAGAVPSTALTDDNTLPVQNGPGRAVAFSALRYAGTGAAGGTLTLTFSGQPPALAPSIDACPVTSGWQPGHDQPWDRRPTYDCTHGAKGSPTAGQVTWRIGAALVRDGTLDLALVPAPGELTPFAVSFAAPTADSFTPLTGSNVPAPDIGSLAGGAAAALGPTPAPVTANVGATGGTTLPAAPPVLAPSAGAGGALATPPAARAAATREPASRAVGAGALAALAFALLARSLTSTGARRRPPTSLVRVHRRPAKG